MEPNVTVNASDLVVDGIKEAASGFFNNLPGSITSNIAFIINLGKALGIAILIYIIFMIIRSITQIRSSLRMKGIAKNVEEINKKMDIVIGKKSTDKDKKKK